jgi:hypothetical protein
MVAIMMGLIYKLRFLCTPMSLESVEAFEERTAKLQGDEADEEMRDVVRGVMDVLKETEAIPSALPPLLLEELNNSYIRHLSPLIGLFGCQKDRMEWKAYDDAYSKYSEEVEQLLSAKVASVVEDAADNEDLKKINEHLIIKWAWLNKGIFDGQKWSTSTRIPLLTQTVIKNLDSMVDEIGPSFEEVRTFKHV